MAPSLVIDLLHSNGIYNRSIMKRFSIRELEWLSGIKAHTIRIWEKRYQAFLPQRSSGQTRSYSLADVQRLLSMALLLKKGYKISSLSDLPALQLEQRLQLLVDDEDKQERALNHLIFYMYSDIEKFEDVLDGAVLCWGIETTIEKLILPFLEKVELFSYKDKSCETHFVVTAIRKKIILGIEKINTISITQKTALLFLPEQEHYDLILLYMAFLLKQKGIRVLYLGTNISTANLQRITELKKPDFFYTYIPQGQKFKLSVFASFLEKKYSDAVLFAATYNQASFKEQLENVEFLHFTAVGSVAEKVLP